MKLIIDIPEVFYEYCKTQEDAIEIQLAVKNGTPLPDNATNGDVIKAMFPNALRSDYAENDMIILYLQDENSEDWWDAPYKAESEDKE